MKSYINWRAWFGGLGLLVMALQAFYITFLPKSGSLLGASSLTWLYMLAAAVEMAWIALSMVIMIGMLSPVPRGGVGRTVLALVLFLAMLVLSLLLTGKVWLRMGRGPFDFPVVAVWFVSWNVTLLLELFYQLIRRKGIMLSRVARRRAISRE